VKGRKFRYKARNESGRLVGGTITAESETAARARLRERRYFVVELKPAPQAGGSSFAALTAPKVTARDLAVFCRQLATMVQAGMPLLTCLNVLGQQSDNKTLRLTAASVAMAVEAGNTLSEALRAFPKIFPELFVTMVEAGETGGALEEVLERLATQLEKDADIRAKVKSAMSYPLVILAVALAAISIILIFVLPTFTEMLTSMNLPLPVPTLLVIGLSDFLRGYWYLVLLSLAGAVFALRQYARTKNGRRAVDRLMLRLPVFGTLIRKMIIARVNRTLSSLVRSGVPLLQSLAIVRRIAGNQIVAEAILSAENSVKEGEGLAKPLERSRVFPPMVTRMIAIGEDTGALDNLLDRVAQFYEREVDATVSRLSSILEPLLMVFFGLVVGFILLAVYLPMFSVVAGIS